MTNVQNTSRKLSNLTTELLPSMSTDQKLVAVCQHLADTLRAKHADYGGSAFKVPVLIPTVSPQEAILCRMSDKVQRIAQLSEQERNAVTDGIPNYQPAPTKPTGKNEMSGPRVSESLNDTLLDLAGYCVLLLLHRHELQSRAAQQMLENQVQPQTQIVQPNLLAPASELAS